MIQYDEYTPFDDDTFEVVMQCVSRYDCRDCRNMIVLNNLRLVPYVVGRYFKSVTDYDDNISMGYIGLIRAVETFNMELHNKFSSYATRCIYNEIATFNLRHIKKHSEVYSLNHSLNSDELDDVELMDTLLCTSPTSDILYYRKEFTERMINAINSIKSIRTDLKLDRKREVFLKYYGLDGGRTHTSVELAAIYGVKKQVIFNDLKFIKLKLSNIIDKGELQ